VGVFGLPVDLTRLPVVALVGLVAGASDGRGCRLIRLWLPVTGGTGGAGGYGVPTTLPNRLADLRCRTTCDRTGYVAKHAVAKAVAKYVRCQEQDVRCLINGGR
jgi:hypothetical protein